MDEVTANTLAVKLVLSTMGVDIVDVKATRGPFIDSYAIFPAPGVKTSDILRKASFLEKALKSNGFRMYLGDDAVTIEIVNSNFDGDGANKETYTELIKTIVSDPIHELPIAIGIDTSGGVVVLDPAQGSGILAAGNPIDVSRILNIICLSACNSRPEDLRVMQTTSTRDSLIPVPAEMRYLGNPCADTPADTTMLLDKLCQEMEKRSAYISNAGYKDIVEQRLSHKSRPLPYILAVLDGVDGFFKDRRRGKEMRRSLLYLASNGPKTGIFPVVGCTGASADALLRFHLRTMILSKMDSATCKDIIGTQGAECLIGGSDSLLYLDGIVKRFTAFNV